MLGTVYLKITDLHQRDRNFTGRKDYAKESARVWDKVLSVVTKYKDAGYEVVIILMGDLFHSGYIDITEAILANNRIIHLRMLVRDIYFVIGNHELTYYKDNPMWTLVTEIRSARVRAIQKKVWQPRGIMPIMHVEDELIDGNVRFIFNHYGTGVAVAPLDGKTNIGVFHQDLYAKDIHQAMEASYGTVIFEHIPVYFDQGTQLYGYNYASFGHAHQFYGKFKYVCEKTGYTTIINYLSTLGRTSSAEVIDGMLERNIPAYIVKDGELITVEDNLFLLEDRASTVIEEIVVSAREKRKEAKQLKQDTLFTKQSDDPIENIRIHFASNKVTSSVLNDLLQSDESELEQLVKKTWKEVLYDVNKY